MNTEFLDHLNNELAGIKQAGFSKSERIIAGPQGAAISLTSGKEVINFCANNYLGLADNPHLIAAAKKGMDDYGFGCASVRFICGTQNPHKQLERALSDWLGTDDSILYSSCFDANTGLFETLLTAEDAIISDALNHASIIDGVRLCKAKRYRYANNDMADLETQLQAADADGARFKLVVTDGVFSMDGIIADLASICQLAECYNALVMVDDSHAVGFIGETGAGTPEYCGVSEQVDIYSGTLGKALGGASGGYIAARQPIVDLLRERSRPYLFSNSLAPAIVAASLEVLSLINEQGEALRARVQANAKRFREGLSAAGFELVPGEHPIIPVMLHDAALASQMADALLDEGIYVIAFSYPVVPKGKARIRTQMSAAHSEAQIDQAIDAFTRVGQKLGVIS
ncbi:glycine C-acetyltransferase [Suttonella sp. R2A3]|uniref:glycine C-acetyltransferase n=1 Tax=Suttonella sp. R2A3 TaxID=2908648 RepID=UPI001F22E47C|nr:glycine C-acetyltransferase [Suttonella sp. R2A3]UJF24267.1 glycine C-acetyltransferase [Suttonella sp. R2A3]